MHRSLDQLDRVEQIYAQWGRHPRVYAAQDWLTFLGRHKHIRERAVEALDVGPGARVLEVGCGTGRNFRYIEQHIGDAGTLIGLDYSPEMLDAARRLVATHRWRNVHLIRGDAAELAVGDARFDAVLSVLAMSTIPGHMRALERCRDVLRPGGVLAVCDARLFTGKLRVLDPLVRAIYQPLAGWDPDRDLPADIQRVFGHVAVEIFNAGSLYIATARRGD